MSDRNSREFEGWRLKISNQKSGQFQGKGLTCLAVKADNLKGNVSIV